MEEKVRKVPRRLVGCLGRRGFAPSGVAGGVGTGCGEKRRRRLRARSQHEMMGGITAELHNTWIVQHVVSYPCRLVSV